MTSKPSHFMHQALLEARKASEKDEVPVGAVLVLNGKIVARAHNQVEQLHDATAHAEMLAITGACAELQSKFLDKAELYVTLEPCPMCAGAIGLARITKLYWAADDERMGFTKFSDKVLHPKTKVIRGEMGDESAELLREYFRGKR
jgi:tRNA(adenine34) deaminase